MNTTSDFCELFPLERKCDAPSWLYQVIEKFLSSNNERKKGYAGRDLLVEFRLVDLKKSRLVEFFVK